VLGESVRRGRPRGTATIGLGFVRRTRTLTTPRNPVAPRTIVCGSGVAVVGVIVARKVMWLVVVSVIAPPDMATFTN
jgi:hypothetical protein